MLSQVAFFIVAAVMLGAGFRAVTAQNLVHTVLWLGVTLAGTSIAFILLDAHFLAAIQIILYTGGILTLMLFGVMLTQREQGVAGVKNPSHRFGSGVLLAVAVAAMLGGAILRTPLPSAPAAISNTRALGTSFLTEHVLAFEVLSLLLLGAVLGAIVIARRRDAGEADDSPATRIPARRKLELGGTR